MDVWEDRVIDPDPYIVTETARRDVDQPNRRLKPFHLRKLTKLRGKLRATDSSVQEHCVNRINVVVVDLNPIARPHILRPKAHPVSRELECVEERKHGTLVGRPHVREDEPSVLSRRVRSVTQAVL
jgi:hypothetical protein